MLQLKIIAVFKYMTSFFKGDLKLADYPIRLKQQNVNTQAIGQFNSAAWCAQIVNWWQMAGTGATKEEALADLNQNFNEYKSRHGRAPRPGTLVPIQFAPADDIDKYSSIARDFFQKILSMNFDECFVSDLSSLWDFPKTSDEELVFELIKQTYNVDVSDIKTGNLTQIFKRLHEFSTANSSASV